MKARISFRHAALFTFVLALFGFFVTGCKSTPRVDWNTRVGTYTYDQAVTELGPPDKVATLEDGRKVADWITRSHGGGLSFGVGTGFVGGNTAVGVGQSVNSGYGDKVFRLTFGPDNKLLSWKKL